MKRFAKITVQETLKAFICLAAASAWYLPFLYLVHQTFARSADPNTANVKQLMEVRELNIAMKTTLTTSFIAISSLHYFLISRIFKRCRNSPWRYEKQSTMLSLILVAISALLNNILTAPLLKSSNQGDQRFAALSVMYNLGLIFLTGGLVFYTDKQPSIDYSDKANILSCLFSCCDKKQAQREQGTEREQFGASRSGYGATELRDNPILH